jgi:transcriptional regulator with XRE-family HTH domain
MTPADFRACRVRLGLSQAAMAEALGISLSSVNDYESGLQRGKRAYLPRTIPRAVELACRCLEEKR